MRWYRNGGTRDTFYIELQSREALSSDITEDIIIPQSYTQVPTGKVFQSLFPVSRRGIPLILDRVLHPLHTYEQVFDFQVTKAMK